MSQAEAFRQCVASVRAGRLVQAEAQGRALLRNNPSDAVLWHLLGVIVARQDRPDEALALFGKALEITPRSASILHDQAIAFHRIST